MATTLPPSANYHLTQACNFGCHFCFATFKDVPGTLKRDDQIRIIDALAEHGVQKLTFAGGEPFVVKWIDELIAHAKSLGLTTMVVTNGSLLTEERLRKLAPVLDWLVISFDSQYPETNRAIGRATRKDNQASATEHYLEIARVAKDAGIRLKINTVVTSKNSSEDFSDFLRISRPERWKVLEVRAVEGQNDGRVEELLIDPKTFQEFVDRHQPIFEELEIAVTPEFDDDMRGSYVMVDPKGRFFDSSAGHHTYSEPILDVGVAAAFPQVNFDHDKYLSRGASYQWERGELPSLVAIAGHPGAGKDTLGDMLVEQHGYVRVAIADPIKDIVGELFDFNIDQLYGDARNVNDARLNKTPREVFRKFGEACRELDPQIWIRQWLKVIDHHLANGRRVVCTDIRMYAELEAVRGRGAHTVLLSRTQALTRAPRVEVEECEILESPGLFDVHIKNDGSLDELLRAFYATAQMGGAK